MNDPKHDMQTVLDAIRGEGRWYQDGRITSTFGNVTDVANRLGVTRQTVYNYRDRWKKVSAALQDERAVPVDIAERKLVQLVNEGNITAVIFLLKTLGKDRGYVERHEHSGPDGGAVAIKQIEVVRPVDGSDERS